MSRIGDFHCGQIAYVNGRGWILLDWAEGTSKLPPGRLFSNELDNVYHTFDLAFAHDQFSDLAHQNWKALYPKVLDVIKETREATGLMAQPDSAVPQAGSDHAHTRNLNSYQGPCNLRDEIKTLEHEFIPGLAH
jgi:hypothetical protein